MRQRDETIMAGEQSTWIIGTEKKIVATNVVLTQARVERLSLGHPLFFSYPMYKNFISVITSVFLPGSWKNLLSMYCTCFKAEVGEMHNKSITPSPFKNQWPRTASAVGRFLWSAFNIAFQEH